MKTKLSKRLGLVFYIISAIASFTNAAVYWSMRSIWFFINKALTGLFGSVLPGAFLFFILFLASFIYSLLLLRKYLKEFSDYSKETPLVHIILLIITVIAFSAIDVYLYNQLGNSRNIVPTNLVSALPRFLIVLTIIFFIYFYPELEISRRKAFKYSAAAVLVFIVMLFSTNAGKVMITSGPVIQYLDSKNLAVIWTTNKTSTAFAEYGRDENSLKRVTAAHNGIIDAYSTLHRVILPIDEPSEFLYRVGSTKINNYFENSVEYGNTVLSGLREFKDISRNKNINFLVLNDIHENTKLFEKFLNMNNYDFIVLNGDMVNSTASRKVIENKIIKPISECTQGIKPFYLVRGNHETRGAAVRDLPDFIALPQNRYYYSFQAGPLYAVVLDSGEDKLDSHEEYSGLAGFEEYLAYETAWLEALSKSEEYKSAEYKIAFVHIPLNDFDDQMKHHI